MKIDTQKQYSMIKKPDGGWAIFEGAGPDVRNPLMFSDYDGKGRFVVNYIGEGDDGYEHETGHSVTLSPAQKQAIVDYFPDAQILHINYEVNT